MKPPKIISQEYHNAAAHTAPAVSRPALFYNIMKILVACEYSGIVRDAFTAKGHDAISCDLLPTESPGKHYQGNVFDIINNGFDMLIGCPPCQFLSSAGLHFCNIETYGKKAIERIRNRNKAVDFFLDLYSCDIPKKCIENPVGFISSTILKPTQTIHPYYFGERELKRTCLWLVNLPPLQYSFTNDLFNTKTATDYPEPYQVQLCKKTNKIKKRYFVDNTINGLKSAKDKARFFKSVACAMADQWG